MLWERLLPQEAANFLRPTTQPTPAHSAAPTKPANCSSAHQLQVQLLRSAVYQEQQSCAKFCIWCVVTEHKVSPRTRFFESCFLCKRRPMCRVLLLPSMKLCKKFGTLLEILHSAQCHKRERCLHETILNAHRVGLRLNHWLPLSCIALICIFVHLCDRSVLLYRSLQNSGRVVTEKPAVPVSPPWCPNQPIRMITTPPILIFAW